MVLESKERSSSSPSQQTFSVFQPPPPPLSSSNSNQDFNTSRVSPNILLIIIILAFIFFISGLLHLLVRFLFRPPNRSPNEINTLTALEGQLQQLFHLHDCGVDQSFIDTLPLFNYDAIKGVKDPFDCAVCLSEFVSEDKLRLLPKCSHAFHMNCIDTWLLSHSTCPICRASLGGDILPNGLCSPVVRILESGSGRERVLEREDGSGTESGVFSDGDEEESGEIETEDVSIKLGKYRSIDGENDGNCEGNSEARRCFSMGSFAYVMNENSSLKVSVATSMKNQSCKKPSLRGHRLAISECGCDSRRELFNSFEAFNVLEIQSDGNDNKSIVVRDGFSVSKIWLRGRKDEENAARMESSRRAFSFRFPVATGESNTKNGDGGGGRRSSVSEIEIKGNSLNCEGDYPSFGRRTLLWLMGRQNKVVDSSFPSNV